MKKLLIALIASILLISCGIEKDSFKEESIIDEKIQSENELSPIIKNIQGDGDEESIFKNSLIISGNNFGDDLKVSLISEKESHSLEIEYDEDSRIVASLPITLSEDNYQLVVQNKNGTDTQEVLILQGEKGDRGYSCTVVDNDDGTKTISCEDGSSISVSDGAKGEKGDSCTVVDNGDGTKTISCEDGSSVIVSDGSDGAQGPQGYSCWDLNQNGIGDITTEDINGDNAVDILDCQGAAEAQGEQGGSWDGDFNDSGYPDVTGTYSITTKEISMECTDGSSDTLDAIPLDNMVITQSINNITMESSKGDVINPGMTIIEQTEATGNVDIDGTFIITQFLTATMEGISGNLSISYNFSGSFNTSGWSGNYNYIIFFQDYLMTCDYSTTFSGRKL